MRRRPSSTMIAGVSVGLVLLVGLGAVITQLPNRDAPRSTRPRESQASKSPAPASGSAETTGFSTPLEAASSTVPPGHILELAEESESLQLFWASPPGGEWDTLITVEASGAVWRVTRTEPWSVDEAENGSATSEDAPSSAGVDEAEDLVRRFLTAIKQDRPNDARALTISPLHEDPASSQVSDGEFTGFEIEDVAPRGNGTFWVRTSETWTYGTENWRYDIVATRSGLRIRDIEPAE